MTLNYSYPLNLDFGRFKHKVLYINNYLYYNLYTKKIIVPIRWVKNMENEAINKPVEILLIEDNPADARLVVEVLKDSKIKNKMHVIEDGVTAMDYLHQEGKYKDCSRPDIILLDLNLPKKDGREVLKEIKEDPKLKCILVVILTTSSTKEDINQTYSNHANCFITKPVDFDQFLKVVQSIEDFWLTGVRLP